MIEVSEIRRAALSCLLRPLFLSSVPAGFPSSADDYIDKQLDLNELMIKHPAATFYVKATGDSMRNAGISPGDMLVVDRAIEPSNGKIVVAILNGEFTVKRIRMDGKRIWLQPENGAYRIIEITPETDFEVWGVVTFVIHQAQ